MTPGEALEQVAMEFEQRRTKLLDAAADARLRVRGARTETAMHAEQSYLAELHVQARELTWAIDRLRERALRMRSEAAA